MHGLKIPFPIHAEIINNIKEEAKMKVQKIEIHVSNDDTKYFVLKVAKNMTTICGVCMSIWGKDSIITLKMMVIWKVF